MNSDVRCDGGAYMEAVRRLKVAPPPTLRFAPAAKALPNRPPYVRTISTAGWCAEEGDGTNRGGAASGA